MIKFRRWFFSPDLLQAAKIPKTLRTALDELPHTLAEDASVDLVACLASDLLLQEIELPDWVGVESKFLIVMDLPEPSILRLPSLLRTRKPDQRMHVSRDLGVVKRAIIALHREHAWESILDAYVLGDHLIVVCGDLSVRQFPREMLPGLRELSSESFRAFELDTSGSYLHWPEADLHLGPSQMLQAVDPMYLADVEIQRYAMEKISLALLEMREERELKQTEISGLSERQVRRLENEESRFTVDAAKRYAETFALSLEELLAELSRRVTKLRDSALSSSGSEEDGQAESAERVYV